jgi:hypothetical protein
MIWICLNLLKINLFFPILFTDAKIQIFIINLYWYYSIGWLILILKNFISDFLEQNTNNSIIDQMRPSNPKSEFLSTIE